MRRVQRHGMCEVTRKLRESAVACDEFVGVFFLTEREHRRTWGGLRVWFWGCALKSISRRKIDLK